MKPAGKPLRTARQLALLLAAFAAFMPAFGEERAPGADVASLLDFARGRNPEYAAMRHEADAAAARVEPAGALPDPMLKVELENITNYGMENRSTSLLPNRVGATRYTISQTIPFWGKRDLKREAAEAEAEKAQGQTTAGWSELVAKIKTTFARYYLAAGNIKLTKEILELMSRTEALSRVRYANGLVPQQDVIRAQVEITGIKSELVMLESDLSMAQARLNMLLARQALAPLAEPQQLRPLPAPAKLDFTGLAQRAREHNPKIFTEVAGLRAAEKKRALTYRERYPDFTLGVAPMQERNRVNQWGVMIEMNIPLQQGSRRAMEREAEAMVAAAEAKKEAAANQVLADLAENLAGIEAARRNEQLASSSLLPQAELNFQSALSAYGNGKIDFATLLDAQRQIRKARQDTLKAQVQAQERLAEIERLLGEDL